MFGTIRAIFSNILSNIPPTPPDPKLTKVAYEMLSAAREAGLKHGVEPSYLCATPKTCGKVTEVIVFEPVPGHHANPTTNTYNRPCPSEPPTK